MQNNTTSALDLIIRWEGPEVNISPSEPGGISKYGISLTTYADYCHKNNLPLPSMDTIKNLTEQNARDFYGNVFLPAVRFNDLPNGVDVRTVDISVNLGITGGINQLQLVIGQWPLTGTITNDQIKLLNTYDPSAVVLALSTGWISNKHMSLNWWKYGHGWTNRNNSLTQNCINVIQGKAIDLS